MTSEQEGPAGTAPERSHPLPPDSRRSLLSLSAAGLAAGGWMGLLEGTRAGWMAPLPFGPSEFAAVVALYLLAGVALGVVASLFAGRRASPGGVALWVILGQASLIAFVFLLPRERATPSLAVNGLLALALLLAVGSLGRFLLRRCRMPAGNGWLLRASILPVGAALAAALWGNLRDLPPAPGPRPPVVRDGIGRPPNLLVVLADSVRADRVGCCGGPPGLTPRIDAFAEEGLVLSRMRTSSAWTKPSVASLLTGQRPERHRLLRGPVPLAPGTPTFLSFADAAGYRTALLSDSHWPVPEFGFDRGVNSLLLVPGGGGLRGSLPWRAWALLRDAATDAFRRGTPSEIRGARDLGGRLLSWIDLEDPRPFAAYVHWMEPHHPYAPEEPSVPGRPRIPVPVFTGMVPPDRAPAMAPDQRTLLMANYDDEVRAVDRAFGELVDGLRERGLLENTVLLFLSDHGEEFHEHGGWTHEHSLHEEIVRIPCVLRGPGVPKGRRDGENAGIEDLLPTLLEAAGLRVKPDMDGSSLLPRYPSGSENSRPFGVPFTGQARRPTSPVLLRSAVRLRWKMIRQGSGPLRVETWYDLEADPEERTPMAAPPPGYESALLGAVLDEAAELEARSPEPEEVELGGDLRRVLEGLGYFGGSGGK